MPPTQKQHKQISFPCFTPDVSQKRQMYFYLKMLLHLNGSFPNVPALKSFWEMSAKQKLEILTEEIQDTKYNPKSIFSELNMFYQKLIQMTLMKCPTAFKKDELLHSWYSKLGKTCQEFRENELHRWKVYIKHKDQYEKDFIVNQKTFDEKKVKNCNDLKQLCCEYYGKYSAFSENGTVSNKVTMNYDQLIQSVMVSQHPLVGRMAQSNPEGSIRHSNYHPVCPRLLASLDPQADLYIQSNEIDKIKMLTNTRTVKWTVMQVRQQEVLDYTHNLENPIRRNDLNTQYEKITMDNHDWIFEELSILIQNPEAKAFIEKQRQKCFQEIQKYMLSKKQKQPMNDDSPSLSQIFQTRYECSCTAKQSDEIIPKMNKKEEQNLFARVLDSDVSLSSQLSKSSGEISSTLSGIDDDFWNSKVPTCSICFNTKSDLPPQTQWCACKEKKGHLFCNPCFKQWRKTSFLNNIDRRNENAYAQYHPLKCPICKHPIQQQQNQLIQFGEQKQLDDQRELNEIVLEKIQKKEQQKVSKRVKKQFLKQINKEIQQKTLEANNGQVYREWDDQVSSLWVKKIQETQKKLEELKKVKFTHSNEEMDYNEHQQKKYLWILREGRGDENSQNDEDSNEESQSSSSEQSDENDQVSHRFSQRQEPSSNQQGVAQRATDILPRLGLRQQTLHELRHGMFTFQQMISGDLTDLIQGNPLQRRQNEREER